jgi:hypothetical protein
VIPLPLVGQKQVIEVGAVASTLGHR